MNTGLAARAVFPTRVIVGGQVAPAEHALPLFDDDLFEQGLDCFPLARIAWEEDRSDAVRLGRRQRDPERCRRLAEELVRHLDEHAGPVSRVDLAPAGTPMKQVAHDFEGLADELVRSLTLDVHHKTDATRIVLESWIVQTLRAWGELPVHCLSTRTVHVLLRL